MKNHSELIFGHKKKKTTNSHPTTRQHSDILTLDFPEAGGFLSFDADSPEVCLAVRQPPPHLQQSTFYIVPHID